jgi:hypothetical protein
MYKYYSVSALEEEKIIHLSKRRDSTETNINTMDLNEIEIPKENNKLTEIIDILKTYVKNISTLDYDRLKFGLTKICKTQSILPLVSTTERIVDMVLSVKLFSFTLVRSYF